MYLPGLPNGHEVIGNDEKVVERKLKKKWKGIKEILDTVMQREASR